MRTPHGAADISIRAHAPTTTVHDLVRLVTGQAVPPVAELDGRAIDTSQTIAAAGVAMGSVIDTTASDLHATPAAVALLQLAGRGAGSVRPLAPGRYRLGPGRRINAGELDSAPVEITELELTVGDDGTVEAWPGYSGAVMIGGQRISGPTRWSGGMLAVDGRVFAVESPPIEPARRLLGPPDAAGLVPFSRPPRAGDDGPRLLVVDAVRDAMAARATLWRQRAGDLAAFTVPIGLAGDPPGPITIDLGTERGVALVGTDEFALALARTILVESCTLHGPADLDIAIATRPDRLGRWDWAKWLPHLRTTGVPQFITDDSRLHEWVAQRHARSVNTAGQLSPSHLTLLVVDDEALWSSRHSPLVSLLSSHPVGLRILALTDQVDRAPAACTAVVTETDSDTARLLVPDRHVDVEGIVAALAETRTACTVARHLAPLEDTEQLTMDAVAGTESAPDSLRTLFAPIATDVDGIVERWNGAATSLPERLRVPLGLSAGQPLSIDVGPDHNVLVRGTSAELAAGVAISIVGAMAAQLPPSALRIVHVASRANTGMDRIDDLPHFAGRFSEPGAAEATRLIVRLASVIGGIDPDRERIVVVLDDAQRTATASPGLASGLIELAEALPALQLVLTTESRHPDTDQLPLRSFAVQIAVDDAAGSPRGSVRIDSERLHLPFVPYHRPEPIGPAGLSVRPAVYGRTFSALERRLDLLARRAAAGSPDDDVGRLFDALGHAAQLIEQPPSPVLVPRPLPPTHRSTELLAEKAGDAIPIGLIDLPEHLDATPLWWQPGPRGSMLFLGSPRSGVDAALSTLILGVAARFSADDLEVHAIDPVNRRREAARLLPHAGSILAPDRITEVAALLDQLADEAERRLAAGASAGSGAPAVLLLVHDLGQLRRLFTGRGDLARRLDAVARAGAVNMNIAATAYRVEEAGSLLGLVGDRLVGAMAEPADYDTLGVVDPTAIEGQVGRCYSTATERIVQLATPPDMLTAEIEGMLAEPAGSPLPRPHAVETDRTNR